MSEWPKLWQNMFLKPHKNRDERYKLFCFFYQNGMRAEHAVFWVMWHCTYDKNAWQSITDAANDTLTDRGRNKLFRTRVYNIYLGRVD